MNRDSFYRVLRTLVQFVAGGGLALLTNQLVQDLSAAYVPYLTIGYTILVCLCQHLAEDLGWVTPRLKPTAATEPE